MTEFGVLVRTAGNPAAEARAAERLGFDFLAAGEHVSYHTATTNSLLCLAAAATVTDRIGLMSSITLGPVYPPPLLAKMAGYLDSVSGGRFEMGLGIGGENPNELAACGIPVGERGARAGEMIGAMRQLWAADGPSSFQGRFTAYEDLQVEPSPSGGHVPIWVSGRSDAAIRRAAKHSCDWLPYMYTPSQVARSLTTFAQYGDHVPRAGVLLWTSVHDDLHTARSMAVRSLRRTFDQDFTDLLDAFCLVGPPERIVARLREYLDAGATRILFAPCAESDDELDMFRTLVSERVLPELRGIPQPLLASGSRGDSE